MSEEKKQQLTVEYAGMTITVPIMLNSVMARDLELQKRAFMNAAEDAFMEYLYVNRLGRYSMIPKDDEKSDRPSGEPAAAAAKKHSRKK